MLKSLFLQDNHWGYGVQSVNMRSNHSHCAQKVKKRQIANLVKREVCSCCKTFTVYYVKILIHQHTCQLPLIHLSAGTEISISSLFRFYCHPLLIPPTHHRPSSQFLFYFYKISSSILLNILVDYAF